MIADVRTVIWREWKELFLARGGRRGVLLTVLLPLAMVGVFLPWQAGRDWVASPALLIAWAWIPLFLVVNVVADSFAGERERHTLETLLASRLPDRAILLGKVGAAVSYGWGLTLLMLFIGLVTVNVAHGQGELLLYSPGMALGILGFSFLGAVLAAGGGVLVSLRASSAREAQQGISVALMLLLFVPIFGVQMLPAEWKAPLMTTFAGADMNVVLVGVAGVLAVLDGALLVGAAARFQRARLILD